ncbi:tyrosine recombinase XerC [Heyndrickxia sporothermodurans]|nr:tyrosine recombinase XerC [Heyndrickxia sporothermodurans]
MFIEDILEEYMYHCQAKGFTNKTMKNKRQEFKQLKMYLREERGITDLESITVHDLRAYARLKQQQGLQAQSIVSMFRMIKAFFSWCYNEEYIKENFAKKVELSKVPVKILNGFTADEIQSMTNSFSYKSYIEARSKAIIAVLADCGLRAMEIRGLKTNNVRNTSILVNGKGNKERIMFISPVLKRILIKYERIKNEYFKDKDTTENYFLSYTGNGISHVALDNIIKEAGKRANVKDKRGSPHTFRHFYAVQCWIGYT